MESESLKNVNEAIGYVKDFLAYYQQDNPEEFEEPQDMLRFVLAVLETTKAQIGE